jgi:hypothetical protein
VAVPIPVWTAEGVLPPIDATNPTSSHRAPYPVSLYDVVVRFGTSPARCAILEGFLNHRAALHANGYRSGFQWLDGSFMEDIEVLESRIPKDMDVVSFVQAPQPASPSAEDQQALDHDLAKAKFHVDHYFVEIDVVPPRELTFWSAYWYSMWSHRRTRAWKGFLQVELDPNADANARHWLVQNTPHGVKP